MSAGASFAGGSGMRFLPLTRSGLLRLLLAAIPAAALACSAGNDATTAEGDVTSVENTNVKSQAIANCWLYATAGWVESLHKGATARDIDVSEAYYPPTSSSGSYGPSPSRAARGCCHPSSS